MSEKLDRQKTLNLISLLSAPQDKRDQAWYERFYAEVADALLKLGEPNYITISTGFPCLHLTIPEANEPFTPITVEDNIQHLLKKGLGIAISDRSTSPDPQIGLSYGELWWYSKSGKFNKPAQNVEVQDAKVIERFDTQQGPVTVETSEKERDVLVGAPSEDYFPDFARRVVCEFLGKELGIAEPSVVLLSEHGKQEITQSLAFNLFPDDFANGEEHAREFARLSWFFPTHYNLTGLTKKWSSRLNWTPLQTFH